MAEATPAREGEEAGTRPVLDVTALASTPFFSFSFSLTIADRPLAAGALVAGIGCGVALAALLYKNPELVTRAVRGALEGPGLQVGNIAPGSIIVELQCNTKESFLLFLEDFETKKVKQRLEEEFFKIGFKEELEVAIMNDKEVYAKLGQIRKLDKTRLEEEKGEKPLLTEAAFGRFSSNQVAVSCKMATGKMPKDIDEIEDVMEMFELMSALGISCKGFKTLEEMKARVKEQLHQSQTKHRWIARQAFSILSDAKDEEAKKRQGLLNFYNEAESFMEKMDGSILALLQQNVGNIKEKMKNHNVQLQQKGYFLLVAGKRGQKPYTVHRQVLV